MSAYPPPNQDLPIFNPVEWDRPNIPLTINDAKEFFLEYPNAQGSENLQTIVVNGGSTFNDTASFNDLVEIDQPTSTLNALNVVSDNPGVSITATARTNPNLAGLLNINGSSSVAKENPIVVDGDSVLSTSIYGTNDTGGLTLTTKSATTGSGMRIAPTENTSYGELAIATSGANTGKISFPDGTEQTTAFTGAGQGETLADVLTSGNSAGANTIDMNNNQVSNASSISFGVGGAGGSQTKSYTGAGASAGVYSNTNITIDADGQITSISNGTAGTNVPQNIQNGGQGVSIDLTTPITFLNFTDEYGVVLPNGTTDGQTKEITITDNPTSSGVSYGQSEAISPVVPQTNTPNITGVMNIGGSDFLIGGTGFLKKVSYPSYNNTTWTDLGDITSSTISFIQGFKKYTGTQYFIYGSFNITSTSQSYTFNNIAIYDVNTNQFVKPLEQVANTFNNFQQPIYAVEFWTKTGCIYIGGAFTIYPTPNEPYFTCWKVATGAYDNTFGGISNPNGCKARAMVYCIESYTSQYDNNTNYIQSTLIAGGSGLTSTFSFAFDNATTGNNCVVLQNVINQGLQASYYFQSNYDVLSLSLLPYGSSQLFAIWGYGMLGIGKFMDAQNSPTDLRSNNSAFSPVAGTELAYYYTLNPNGTTPGGATAYGIESTGAGGMVNQIRYSPTNNRVNFCGNFDTAKSNSSTNVMWFNLTQNQASPPSPFDYGATTSDSAVLSSNATNYNVDFITTAKNNIYSWIVGGSFLYGGDVFIGEYSTNTNLMGVQPVPASPHLTGNIYYQGASYTLYQFVVGGDSLTLIWSSVNNKWYMVNYNISGVLE